VSAKHEKRFRQLLNENWRSGTPGFRLQAYQSGRKKIDLALGQTYDFYDWASLTKIVFSATQMMRLFDRGLYRLDQDIRDFVPWFSSPAPAADCKIKNLLNHSAGLAWWKPLYKKVSPQNEPARRWNALEAVLEKEMKKDVRQSKRKAARSDAGAYRRSAVYSDLDLFILGAMMKRLTEKDFAEMWSEIQDDLGLAQTHFHIMNRPVYQRSRYAPTENCPWRERILQGEVHDENTWALGGVAPHSGLFGPIDDLSRWGLSLRDGIIGRTESGLAHAPTVRLFTRRSLPRTVGDWALGFMMPSKKNATCGRFFSRRSVGHLGFTGTSLWFDPKNDLLVTILANRVNPTRENRIFPQMRGHIHDCVVRALTK